MKDLDFLLILCPPWGFSTPPLGAAYVLESVERSGLFAKFADINTYLLKDVKEIPNVSERIAKISHTPDPKSLWLYSALPIWHDGKLVSNLFGEVLPLIWKHLNPYLDLKPKVIGFSIYRDNLYFSVKLARALHERLPDVPVIFGGPWLKNYYHKEAILPDSADLLIFGEAEQILPKILTEILSMPAQNRRNLVKEKFNSEIVAYPVDLNEIPYPKYKSFEMQIYQPHHACVITTRGCPKRCAFCIDWVLARKYRERAVENVLDELEFLVKNFKMKVINFNDLNLGVNVKRMKKIAEGIIERKLDIIWDANLSISEELDEDAFELLKKSGARTLQFGIESASQKILKLMGKDYSPELAKKVLKAAHDAGLKPIANFVVGYPDETEDDFNETAAFLIEVAKYLDQIGTISTLHIVPLTCLAKSVNKLGIEPIEGDSPYEHNWRQNELDLKTRIERAYRLIELAKSLNLKMIHSNVEIDKVELNRYIRNDEK